MNTSRPRPCGFTLIELLTVIAIIGILAGILIPTVGAAKTSAKRTASLVFFHQLEVALAGYKAEYGYFPSQIRTDGGGASTDASIDLSKSGVSEQFVKLLSARNADGTTLSATDITNLNPRAICLFSFADSNFYVPEDTGKVSQTQLADQFNNTAITVTMDTTGDGYITAPGTTTTYRRDVGIRVTEDKDKGMPGYGTY